jgi:hypothetical protein
MCARLAGRLLTSPFAFLFAGILDFTLFAAAVIRRGVRSLGSALVR